MNLAELNSHGNRRHPIMPVGLCGTVLWYLRLARTVAPEDSVGPSPSRSLALRLPRVQSQSVLQPPGQVPQDLSRAPEVSYGPEDVSRVTDSILQLDPTVRASQIAQPVPSDCARSVPMSLRSMCAS